MSEISQINKQDEKTSEKLNSENSNIPSDEETNKYKKQNINKTNYEKKELKEKINNFLQNQEFKTDSATSNVKENSERLLMEKSNNASKNIEPWEIAAHFPESVFKGTEVKIYPFPTDINKEEIYENFNVLGEIIDINIKPVSKDTEVKSINNTSKHLINLF